MENILIRRITAEEVEQAMQLALEVYLQFEAPDYTLEGVETFLRDIVKNETYLENVRRGICPIYAAFDGGEMVGLIGMRASKTHINLAFTKASHHRKGIATAIFRHLLEDVLRENPDTETITLNSSPYGLPFYLHIGFVPLTEEQVIDDIRFTPMRYDIRKHTAERSSEHSEVNPA